MGLHPRLLGVFAALATFALDQIVKLYFLYDLGFAGMHPGQSIAVGPFFNLVMVWNKGVSFGLFPADSMAARIFLLSFSALVVAGLIYWLLKTRDLMSVTGIGLVIGGALGNMLDRLRYGAVADFFHLHAFGYDWYVFNVADAAIVAGVGLLLYESLLGRERPGNAPGGEPGRGPSNEGLGK
jgi:signal peptidase II